MQQRRPGWDLDAAAALGFCLAAAWLAGFIAYCRIVISPIPYMDDWSFIDALRSRVEGRSLWDYLVSRHNGHPVVPARVAFLADYWAAALRLDLMRWLTALILALSAGALFSARLLVPAFDPRVWRLIGRSLLWWFPVTIGIVSLMHWELLTIAATVSNACAFLFSVIAILAAGRAYRKRACAWLAVASLAAIGASLSSMHGVLVWLAMAVQGMMTARPSRWHR